MRRHQAHKADGAAHGHCGRRGRAGEPEEHQAFPLRVGAQVVGLFGAQAHGVQRAPARHGENNGGKDNGAGEQHNARLHGVKPAQHEIKQREGPLPRSAERQHHHGRQEGADGHAGQHQGGVRQAPGGTRQPVGKEGCAEGPGENRYKKYGRGALYPGEKTEDRGCRGPGGGAQYIRVGERVLQHALEQRPGEAQPRAHGQGGQGARQAQVQDNVGRQPGGPRRQREQAGRGQRQKKQAEFTICHTAGPSISLSPRKGAGPGARKRRGPGPL